MGVKDAHLPKVNEVVVRRAVAVQEFAADEVRKDDSLGSWVGPDESATLARGKDEAVVTRRDALADHGNRISIGEELGCADIHLV